MPPPLPVPTVASGPPVRAAAESPTFAPTPVPSVVVVTELRDMRNGNGAVLGRVEVPVGPPTSVLSEGGSVQLLRMRVRGSLGERARGRQGFENSC